MMARPSPELDRPRPGRGGRARAARLLPWPVIVALASAAAPRAEAAETTEATEATEGTEAIESAGMAAVTATSAAGVAAEARARSSTAAESGDVIQLYPETEYEEADASELELTEATEDAAPSALGGLRARASIKLEARIAVDAAFDQRGEHVASLGVGGRIELDVDLERGLSLFAAPSFYYAAAISEDWDDREQLYATIPEAHVTWSLGAFDLRAGALLFNWGSSDLIGPNDVLNPLDYRRNFVAAVDDLKIPVLAAELVATAGPLTVRAVVEPFFTPSHYFVSTWDTALIQAALNSRYDFAPIERLLGETTIDAVGDQLLLSDRPEARPDHATLGLRATLRLGDLDLSGTFVHGWEPLPQIDVHPDALSFASMITTFIESRGTILPSVESLQVLQGILQRGEPLFYGTYRRRDVLGVDAVYVADPFIFKLDAAYSFERTAYTRAYRPVTNPWLNTVVGAEYVAGDDLQVVVEAFNITIFDVPSDVRLAFFEADSPPPSTTTSEGRRTLAIPGVAAVLRYSVLDGDLRFELVGVTTLTRGDLLLLPSVLLEVDDAQELSLGASLVEGRGDGYGGAYSHNDELFLRYQWVH